MSRRRSLPLKCVSEWLPDYFTMIRGTQLVEILDDVSRCEVESALDARNLVNRRIDNWILWLNSTRPSIPLEETWMTARGSA